MKIKLDPTKRHVLVKDLRYSSSQLNFLKKYVYQLLNMGLLFQEPEAECKAASFWSPSPSQKHFTYCLYILDQ